MTGSPIWDLFSAEVIMLENSWNVSFRRMYDLPLQTHRNLVEPVSQQLHLKKLLIKRFLSFIQQIQKSDKILPKQLLNIIVNDTRSITGCNLRRIGPSGLRAPALQTLGGHYFGPSGAVQTVSSKRRRPLFLVNWSERHCADGFVETCRRPLFLVN